MAFLFRRRGKKQTTPSVNEWTSGRSRTTSPALTEQRTYVEDAPYLLPKDAQEDQRLNYQRAPREV